jgi:hypothetical protein
MSESNSSSNSSPPRVTLKLKPGVRKTDREPKSAPTAPTAPIARPQGNGKSKPGAHWSDEYKERMQAEMDALTR